MSEELVNNIALNIKKNLHNLAVISSDAKGVTRLPFTPEARKAVDYLKEYMGKAGLLTYEDTSGAVIGYIPNAAKKAIVIGSHYDSVKNGGAFDGIAGIICGVEIARLVIENGISLPYTIKIVGTNDEEGVRFGGGFFSAKAFLGQLTIAELKNQFDNDGISIYHAMQKYGLVPEMINSAAWNISDIRAFIEIHIEQGPILEANNKDLGIVTGIVGMRRYKVKINGRADHAGTTPMNMRSDALLAASAIISEVPQLSAGRDSTVSTVGACAVSPNMVNTIADNVTFQLDIRSMSETYLHDMEEQFEIMLQQTAKKYNVSYDITTILKVQPTKMNEDIQKIISNSGLSRNYSIMRMYSGAGHDSLPIGHTLPTAMLFVPSEKGRSHCPEEKSSVYHLAKAVLTIYDSIKVMK